jgi:hypothetical protein
MGEVEGEDSTGRCWSVAVRVLEEGIADWLACGGFL